MQAKDIPAAPIVAFLMRLDGRPGTHLAGFENSVQNVMPDGVNEKLARAKMRKLIRRGLVNGCSCGCRGDYEPTPPAIAFVPADEGMTVARRIIAQNSELLARLAPNDARPDGSRP